jgi:transcriptional regulator with XRE-family HTH domain
MGATMDSAFGRRLRELRQAAGLSQNELGRRAGINPGTINHFETGEREPTGRGQVLALADGLGIAPDERDRLLLLAAAHLLPDNLARLGAIDPAVLLAADILADDTIPARQRDEFRWQILLAARRWRPVAPGGTPGPPP